MNNSNTTTADEKLSYAKIFRINELLDSLSAELNVPPNISVPIIFNCNLETYQELFSCVSAECGRRHYCGSVKRVINLN